MGNKLQNSLEPHFYNCGMVCETKLFGPFQWYVTFGRFAVDNVKSSPKQIGFGDIFIEGAAGLEIRTYILSDSADEHPLFITFKE